MDQTQTSRYFLRFEPLLYVPAFTQKDFHYVHTGPPQREPPQTNLQLQTWSMQLLSPTQPPLQKRRHKTKTQSSLHKRDKAQSQTTTSIISTLRGILTQPLQSPLHKRDNNKEKKVTTLGGLTKPQTNFPTKIRSYR